MVDLLFFLAVGAVGWGLSLATYRAVARWNGWPLGTAQTTVPALTMTVGILSAAIGLVFALARGPMHGGMVILVFGVGAGHLLDRLSARRRPVGAAAGAALGRRLARRLAGSAPWASDAADARQRHNGGTAPANACFRRSLDVVNE